MQTPISITDFFSESDLYKRFLHSFAEFEEGQKRPGPKEFDQGLSRLWDMVIRGLELLADKRMDQPLDKIAPLSEGDVTWRTISEVSSRLDLQGEEGIRNMAISPSMNKGASGSRVG